MTRGALALAVAVMAFGFRAGWSDDPVPQYLALARAYVERWQQDLSGVVAEETYVQHLEQRFGSTATLRLRSDVLLVRVRDLWVGFRDIAEIDGRPIAGRSKRLEDLFLKNPLSEALDQARRISDEGSRYNLGHVYRNFNVPTTTLRVLDANRAARVKFSLDGKADRGGQPAIVLSYKESEAPTIVLTTNRQFVFTHGRLWIDPATGRVLATEMKWRLSPPRDVGDLSATITVSYRPDAASGIWVPGAMKETYETAEEIIDCEATYNGVRRFTVTADDTIAVPQ
jgi:hypothetical protein